MAKITLVKTLPHLVPLHLREMRVGLYAPNYSQNIYRYLSCVQYFTGDSIQCKQLLSILADWQRVSQVTEAEQYSVAGDTVNFWPVGYANPLRLEFFGEKAESLAEYDIYSGTKLQKLTGVWLPQQKVELEQREQQSLQVVNSVLIKAEVVIFSTFTPPLMAADSNVEVVEYDYRYPSLFWNRLDLLHTELQKLANNGYQLFLQTKHWQQINSQLQVPDIKMWKEPQLPAGFISAQKQQALFTDREIFGTIYLQAEGVGNSERLLRQLEAEVSVGDYIVHEDYGIGIYSGLTQEEMNGSMQDYLQIKYQDEAEVLVPIAQIGKLTRYIGPEGLKPQLSKLGRSWEQTNKKVKRSVQILARELLNHYARREVAQAKTIGQQDSAAYQQFLQQFEYQPTADQLRASAEILHDLQDARPMNRLLVGDVGFGKTEVMMRAAFKAVEAGWQVAILCPTTVLAAQHYAVFSKRFEGSKYRIESLSRFNTTKENQQIADQLNQGKVQIAIGTHRLLSKDIKFKNLGLLVVDEEQRFGVAQKERIRQLNYGVHYLSVSATPIPRTLSIALSGIQDISLINTAPTGRRAVHTEIIDHSWTRVVEAIQTELVRGGQVYFVHNAVQSIESIKAKLEKLLPQVRCAVAHGQMPAQKLDKVVTDFYLGKFDVLICSTIIENGLDMPNVNTMLINQAGHFGLSQLYQLRGRIGRAQRQGYCYLLTAAAGQTEQPAIDEHTKHEKQRAKQRLETLIQANQLGSSFNIASRDLELRGAGNLLGGEQHGHISTIGYALYMKLLANEIERLKKLELATRVEYVSM